MDLKKNLSVERKWVFFFGLGLVVLFSILIGLLNIGVIYLFGLPFIGLIVGIILIWISRVGLRVKATVSLLPILLIILSFFLFLFLMRAEPEVFLIPLHYQGEIVIFYDEPCGRAVRYENGRRIYEFPNSGILISQFEKNSGHLNRNFFLVDESRSRIEIPQFRWQNFETEKKEIPNESFTEDTVGTFWSYGSETYHLSRNSLAFIIASYRHFERDQKDRWQESKMFTEKAGELLKRCREDFELF